MAKRRNLNVVGFEALGTAFGHATSEAAARKSPVDRRVSEARAKGIKDSLALLREALPAKANHEFYDSVALRAANKVRVANGLDKLDSLLASASPAPSKTTDEKPAKKTANTTKTDAASPAPSKTTGKKLDRYTIDEGDQCRGLTKSETRCKHWGINGSHYCLQHQSQASGTPSKTTGKKSTTDEPKPKSKPDPKPETTSTSPAPTTQEAKPRTKSTREKMIAKKLAADAKISEAEMAEAQAEADFLAEANASTAAYMATQLTLDSGTEALRSDDV